MSSIRRNKIVGIIATSALLGFGYAYLRLRDINKTLGIDILKNSLNAISKKLTE